MSVSWLARRTARPNAHTRLVCFAHSGGTIGEFLRWGDALQDVEVWGVQLPGRGARIAEDAIHRLGPLVEAIVEQARL